MFSKREDPGYAEEFQMVLYQQHASAWRDNQFNSVSVLRVLHPDQHREVPDRSWAFTLDSQ